jgi:NitT/TauT family transport system ATP-binding protein
MSPRPGRIERIIDVALPRPRGLDARRAPEFLDAAQTITDIFLARGVLHGAALGSDSSGQIHSPKA